LALEKKETMPENGAESPSMEEILKSIRGVISGDDAAPAGAASVATTENAVGDDDGDELLELTEELTEMAEDEKSNVGGADSASTNSGTSSEKSVLDEIDDALGETELKPEEKPIEIAEVVEQEAPPAPPAEEKSPQKDDVVDEEVDFTANPVSLKTGERLLAEKVADESSETLKALVNNIPRTQVSSPYTQGGVTLESLTIEAMKPFLAEWLNKNLPTIVKQIVSKEIKKLIPEEDDK
jgi:cell pole-organizing protein PopZ